MPARVSICLPLRRSLVLAAAALLTGIAAAQAEPRATVSEAGGYTRLELSGAEITAIAPGPLNDEILIRFSGPVPQGLASGIERALARRAAYVSAGFDTILIKLAQPAAFAPAEAGGAPAIRFRPAGADAVPGATPGTADRLEIQRARLAAAEGDLGTARQILSRLERMAPGDPEVLAVRAEIERLSGDPRAAAAYYARALNARPRDEFLAAARADTLRAFGPELRAGQTYQTTRDADTQHRTRASGRIGLLPRLDIEGAIESVALDDPSVQRTDGTFGAFDDRRNRGEAALVYDFGGGLEARARGFANGRTGGAGALVLRRSAVSETEAGIAWREPVWDTPEQIAARATRDSIHLRHTQRFDAVSAALGLRYARYGIEDEDDAARTLQVEAGLRWTLPLRRSGLDASIGYSFDAEYVLDEAVRTPLFGADFRPLPIEEREVHALDAGLGWRIVQDLRFEAFAGYAYDRLGDHGPFGGAALVWTPLPDLEMRLEASHSEVAGGRSDTDGGTSRVGLNVIYRLPPGPVISDGR